MVRGRGRARAMASRSPSDSISRQDHVAQAEDIEGSGHLTHSDSMTLPQMVVSPTPSNFPGSSSPFTAEAVHSTSASTAAAAAASCPLPSNGQLTITVVSGRFVPGHTTSDAMTKIFKKMIHENGTEWKTLPPSYPERFFDEFKKQFRWDPSIDGIVGRVFYVQAKTIYRQMVHRFKKDWFTNKKMPQCMTDDIWNRWLQYWEQDEVKNKSVKAHQNRMSEPAGLGTGPSCHTGGSRSFIEHWRDMATTDEHSANKWDFYKRTHCKRGGEFVDGKAKKIADEIEGRIEAAQLSGTPLTNDELSDAYMEASGGLNAKRRVYGMGAMSQSIAISNESTSATSPFDEQSMRRHVEQQVQEQVLQRVDAIRAEIRAEFEVTIAQMRAELLATLQSQETVPRVQPSPRLSEDDDGQPDVSS